MIWLFAFLPAPNLLQPPKHLPFFLIDPSSTLKPTSSETTKALDYPHGTVTSQLIKDGIAKNFVDPWLYILLFGHLFTIAPYQVEAYIWIVLSIAIWIGRFRTCWTCWVWLAQEVWLLHLVSRGGTKKNNNNNKCHTQDHRRHIGGGGGGGGGGGSGHDEYNHQFAALAMCVVMVPGILQAMAKAIAIDDWDVATASSWSYFTMIVALLGGRSHNLFVVMMVGMLLGTATSNGVNLPLLSVTILYWFTLEFLFQALQRSMMIRNAFSLAELRCICMILSMMMIIFVGDVSNTDRNQHFQLLLLQLQPFIPAISAMYVRVALSGFLGCCATTCAITMSTINIRQWWIRLWVNIIGPLVVVEFTLQSVGYTKRQLHFLPMSLQWLMDFLTDTESGYPRYYGLLYWGVILSVTSLPTYYLLAVPTERIPVVVKRKWFHLIAIILFGPVIVKLPQLMALSFVIAICVLMVLETLRRDLPSLQSFYVTFVDCTKDNDDQIIVSHIFLIVGCAAPLWLSLVVADATNNNNTPSMLLAEFGVICIGIGDAMGAVVGKLYGRQKWGGTNPRTLEGSFAMWLSMLVGGALFCREAKDVLGLILATSLTTLLEAFTIHLDNLVLPLAGSTILLLML
ncbi:hypothetical protein IV203_021746 [Nitzschia inconspicua]|uniref:dolichol kinase n=1 Tax=Nitzschia inconspicua TaxID=303405 RepID=A0A9K3PDP2_9STRA|nr:hypothetical protein IV203_021746 [Nitzschia inconspicua]